MKQPTPADLRAAIRELEALLETATALDRGAIERAIESLRKWTEGGA